MITVLFLFQLQNNHYDCQPRSLQEFLRLYFTQNLKESFAIEHEFG